MTRLLAILGAGNIGRAIAQGLVTCKQHAATDITMTSRHEKNLADLKALGFHVTIDNAAAVRDAKMLVVCVLPAQLPTVLEEIHPHLDPARHVVVSVVTGVETTRIAGALPAGTPIVRAMPNTAIQIGESMTCLAGHGVEADTMAEVRKLFDALGKTLVIDESLMSEATALCACGVAFFLRAIRAASQGGIQVGFHAEEALAMAAQTARGAASLLLELDRHPEREIDRVTTPMGCTIAGLNQMEHEGFSSALIRGIVTSANKAAELGRPAD